MWRILQQDKPGDYVIGTGETHSVKEFLHAAFAYAGLEVEEYVRIDSRYFRPTEVEVLIADPARSERMLGWKPRVKFSELVKIMVDSDLRSAGITPPGEGDEILARACPGKWWGVD
jgi:GDPmannose 4,6-dehydratase